MTYRDQLAEIRKSAEATHDDAARTVTADAFAERAIAAITKSLDEESDEDVSAELLLLSKATVQKDAEGKATGVLVPAPEAEETDVNVVAKARLMKRHAQMDALRVELEKSDDDDTKAVAKDLHQAQAKIMQVAAILNLDASDDSFRWNVSRAIGMLKEHMELMRLLGSTNGAGGDVNGAFKTDGGDDAADVSKRTIEKGWPTDLAAADLDGGGKLTEKASAWGPDPKI